jgi:hypothetical protein
VALGEVDAVKFEHDFAPEAEGVGFVEDEVEAAANGAPFALEDGPSGVGGGGDLLGSGTSPRITTNKSFAVPKYRHYHSQTLDYRSDFAVRICSKASRAELG